MSWTVRALHCETDPEFQIKILVELVNNLSAFQHHAVVEATRRALEYINVHSDDVSTRSQAALRLMVIALNGADMTEFRRWSAALSHAMLLPRQAVELQRSLSRGAVLSGKPSEALGHLDEAQRLAREYNLGQAIVEIDMERAQLQTPVGSLDSTAGKA